MTMGVINRMALLPVSEKTSHNVFSLKGDAV